jgi:protein dithiol oxidoreductase (disulfide-forming)
MQKRTFIASVAGLVAAALIPVSALAQTAGKDFAPVTPVQPTENPAKIEVLEFFSYGCIHCYTFHPIVKKWAAKLPADVEFKRIPVSFNRTPWFNLSRLFYALEAIGELNRLDELAFSAIHDKNVKLYDDATIKAWVAQNGVDAQKFAGAYDSFGVQSKAKRADQLAAAYKISGTPSLAVDGRYLVLNEGVNSYEDILARTDKLIGKARAEKKK